MTRPFMVRAVGAALGVAAASLVVATPAMAGTNATSSHYESGDPDCSDNLRNRATFIHTSDNVRAVDDCADGWGAESEVLLNNGVHRVCYNGAGNGTTGTCNYEFAEGVLGQILARSVDNGAFRGSGDPKPFIT